MAAHRVEMVPFSPPHSFPCPVSICANIFHSFRPLYLAIVIFLLLCPLDLFGLAMDRQIHCTASSDARIPREDDRKAPQRFRCLSAGTASAAKAEAHRDVMGWTEKELYLLHARISRDSGQTTTRQLT